ncbi:hypothetical protein M438DRAFT_380110 [Aureobasidium pullulans EXF-150]|uniref:Uncharacterized protein n=1 Tax=Aureobasidium pullulans EXF-150 TaxID=1043002 RepID=A0A074XWE2_AURPU|nr:uncharacterized protein M438DRAFT_380110 [Aureobasidium pullulans EXF-150]KEQ89918.1 hypothetical protein M438DRAFT_380110 [Aureobasidium pullulans EXF-150]
MSRSMFKEPHLSAEDARRLARYDDGVSQSYYDAAIDAMHRFFYDGAGDPAVFLIRLQLEIAEGIRRLPNNYYIWRAYSPDRHGQLQLTFARFEESNVNEHAANNEWAEFYISEAHVPFFRYCNGIPLDLMSDEECRSHIILERRQLLGPAITAHGTVDDLLRGFYRVSNNTMPAWLSLPAPSDAGSQDTGRLLSPAPSDAGSQNTGRIFVLYSRKTSGALRQSPRTRQSGSGQLRVCVSSSEAVSLPSLHSRSSDPLLRLFLLPFAYHLSDNLLGSFVIGESTTTQEK